jgi:hypothetical protein
VGLLATVFRVALDLEAATLRVFVTAFFAGLAFVEALLVTFNAFLAGALAPEVRFARDFGRAALGLSLRGLLLVAAFGAVRREADRLIPFVRGLLILNP